MSYTCEVRGNRKKIHHVTSCFEDENWWKNDGIDLQSLLKIKLENWENIWNVSMLILKLSEKALSTFDEF